MIEAWYIGHTEDPVPVPSSSELDTVLNEVAAGGPYQLAQLLVDGDIEKPHLIVGLAGDHGVVRYGAPDGAAVSMNTGRPYPLPEGWEELIYYFGDHDYLFPPETAEIPADQVRKAAHEFLAAGGARPTGIAWQDD